MRLVNRVSLFFLGALGLILLIYSGVFYVIVRGRLVRQFEQEARSSLNSLVAAVEVEPEEVKWQPLEHTIALGTGDPHDTLRWAVIGDRNTVVENSPNALPAFISSAKSLASDMARDDSHQVQLTVDQWQTLARRLDAPAPVRSERELDEFDEIVIIVESSTSVLNQNLKWLAFLVCALPIFAWAIAAAGGHWFCRRALQPVLGMSEQARAIAGTDFESRMPLTGSGDELDELATAFNKVLDRQQVAFESQKRFASDAAHQLRTPLTVLLGHIDVCLRRPRTSEEYMSTLQLLRNQADELHQIVESLMFLARAEHDAVLPNSETIALRDWLPQYAQRWQGHPRLSDIRLELLIRPEDAVQAPPSLLSTALDNLVGNALKYSGQGSPVSIEAQCVDSQIEISVVDRGHGIPPQDLPSVFEPFFRSKSARDSGVAGTGLGLAIASRIASVLRGRLYCTSQPQQGSRFILSLPAEQHL